MTQSQSQELNKIDKILSDYITTHGFEHKAGVCYKVDTGYSVIRYCNKMKQIICQTSWKIKANVHTCQVEIYFVKKCDHETFDFN